MIKRSTLNSQIPIIHICDYEKYLHIDKVGAEVNVAIVQNIPTDSTAKHKYAPLVLLTEQEYHKLIETYTQEGADWMIKKLDDYKAARGMTYKSDYRAILNWVVKEYEKYKQYGNHRSGYNDKRQRIESNASSAEDYEGAF